MSRWFCKFDGATSGPFTRDELEYLHDRGQFTAATEIRAEGERTWSRAADAFQDLFPPAAVMVAEPPLAAQPLMQVEEPTAAKAAPPPRPTEESEAERRRKQVLMGGGLGIGTAIIIFLLLWLLLTWGGGGFGSGGLAGGGRGTGQGSGDGSGTGPGFGSGRGGGAGSGVGPGACSGSGVGANQATNSSRKAGGNAAGGAAGQSSAGNSAASGDGEGTANDTVEEAALDPAPPPRSAFQKLKASEQKKQSGGSAGSDDGGFLSDGGGGGSDGSEFLGLKVRGKLGLVCDISGSMTQDFPPLVRELRKRYPKAPLILVPGCYFGPATGDVPRKDTTSLLGMVGPEFASDPNVYMCNNTTDAILYLVSELKTDTVHFNNDLQDSGSESAVTALSELWKKKKFQLNGRSLNCDAPECLQEFIKKTKGEFRVDPISRTIAPARPWSP